MFERIGFRFLDWIDRTRVWRLFFKKLNIYSIRFKGYPSSKISDFLNIVDISEPGCHYISLSIDSISSSSLAIGRMMKIKEGAGLFSYAGIFFLTATGILHHACLAAGLIEQQLLDFLK